MHEEGDRAQIEVAGEIGRRTKREIVLQPRVCLAVRREGFTQGGEPYVLDAEGLLSGGVDEDVEPVRALR